VGRACCISSSRRGARSSGASGAAGASTSARRGCHPPPASRGQQGSRRRWKSKQASGSGATKDGSTAGEGRAKERERERMGGGGGGGEGAPPSRGGRRRGPARPRAHDTDPRQRSPSRQCRRHTQRPAPRRPPCPTAASAPPRRPRTPRTRGAPARPWQPRLNKFRFLFKPALAHPRPTRWMSSCAHSFTRYFDSSIDPKAHAAGGVTSAAAAGRPAAAGPRAREAVAGKCKHRRSVWFGRRSPALLGHLATYIGPLAWHGHGGTYL
jgi:hypothetical protein